MTVFGMMKLLVKTFIIKLVAQINVFKKVWLPFLWDFLYSKYDVRYSSFEKAIKITRFA